jgi:hypothetical protein
MSEARRVSAKEKALILNLNTSIYGSFAEIGAGQETASQFFKAGGASGTVAKTMSAYDMAFSDAIYGEAGRYVSEGRLVQMLDKEYGLLKKRLHERESKTNFFAFANTVETTNFHRTNQGHGWLGVKFQLKPMEEPNECIIHIVLHDNEASWQQRAIGIIGVNFIYGCFYLSEDPELFIKTLLDGIVPGTVEVDMIRFKGEGLKHIDNRLMSLKLVKNGLTKTAMFGPDGSVLQPSEALYKRHALVFSGRFRPFTKVHGDMLEKAANMFRNEEGIDSSKVLTISELSLNALIDANGNVNTEDFLDRVDILCALGHTVMITNFLDYWYLVPYLSKATRNQLIGFVLSVRNIERIFDENEYVNLNGGLLQAFSMLFGAPVIAYVHPAFRSSDHQLITLENASIPENLSGLYSFLLMNNKIKNTLNADLNILDINSDSILDNIKSNTFGWENSVPEAVAKMIKDNCLFDFPCLPEINDKR